MYEWIPITTRPVTNKERRELGLDEDITHTFTCQLPDNEEDILISLCNGRFVVATVFYCDEYGVGDENDSDWLTEVDAWMPMPKGYTGTKPTITVHDHDWHFSKRVKCGNCRELIGEWRYGREWYDGQKEEFISKYHECPTCGTKIDWSDEK